MLHFSPRNSFSLFLGSSPSSPCVLNLVEFLCLDYSTVSTSARSQLVTVILFPLLCPWTFSGGLLFFHSFIVFVLLSLPSGTTIFPPMPVFMVAAPLVARSALALFFLVALRPLANYGVIVPLPAELALTVHLVPQQLKHWLIIFHKSPLPPSD